MEELIKIFRKIEVENPFSWVNLEWCVENGRRLVGIEVKICNFEIKVGITEKLKCLVENCNKNKNCCWKIIKIFGNY